AFHTEQQHRAVAGVHQGVNAFGKHGSAAAEKRSDKFRSGNRQICADGRDNRGRPLRFHDFAWAGRSRTRELARRFLAPWDLGAFFARFGKTDGDGLLAAFHAATMAVLSAAQSAVLSATHSAGDSLLRCTAVPSHYFLLYA